MTLHVQLLTMITMICGGFYIGIAYDTFQRFSSYWKRISILSYTLEIAFWLIQTFILFFVLVQVNNGQLRIYVFAACLLGVSLYHFFIANTYRKILNWVVRLLTTLLRWIWYIIMKPLALIIHILRTIMIYLVKLLYGILRFCLRLIWFPIYWFLRLLYHCLPQKIQNYLHTLAGFYCIIENKCRTWLIWFRTFLQRRK